MLERMGCNIEKGHLASSLRSFKEACARARHDRVTKLNAFVTASQTVRS